MRGRASTITDLGDGRLLRIGGDPEREARLMALAASRGVPVPRVDEIRDDGLVLEHVPGRTMADALRRRPWRMRAEAATLATLLDAIHAIPLDGGTLLHLDLHPENVLYGPNGPVVIDWTNARAGEPAMDIALTWVILVTSGGAPGRVLGALFRRRVGRVVLRAGLDGARAYRMADPNVTGAERERVAALRI